MNRPDPGYRHVLTAAIIPVIFSGLFIALFPRQPMASPILAWGLDAFFNVFVPWISYFFLAQRYKFSLRNIGFPDRPQFGQLFRQALVCTVALCITDWFVFEVSWSLLWQFDWVKPGATPSGMLGLLPTVLLWRYICIAYLALTAAIIEEIYFRGLLRHWCSLYFGDGRYAQTVFLGISPVLFGLVHWQGGLSKVITMFFVGLVAARLYIWTKNLWPLILGHLAMDLIFI